MVIDMSYTAQNMKIPIRNFCSKWDQIRRKLWICSHLVKKSVIGNCIFCAVLVKMLFQKAAWGRHNIRHLAIMWDADIASHYSSLVEKLGYVTGKNWYRKFDLQINLILARIFLNTDCCITFSPFFIKFLAFRSLLSKFSGATYFCVAFVLI